MKGGTTPALNTATLSQEEPEATLSLILRYDFVNEQDWFSQFEPQFLNSLCHA